ncbi:MAG: hypothetical protein EBS19_15800, partial [Spirochaetia bacterium]|nr:hypothetical protein [Spirochaetia bacterium]
EKNRISAGVVLLSFCGIAAKVEESTVTSTSSLDEFMFLTTTLTFIETELSNTGKLLIFIDLDLVVPEVK